MASKSGFQQFQSNWSKTLQWAQQNKIPQSVYLPVYQMDSKKLMTSGYGMSEAERITAIKAAAGLNYSNVLPTDDPSPTNILHNTVNNAEEIFTGLNPVNLAKDAFDTVTNTIEHPSSVTAAFENKDAFYQHVMAPHSILSWIPGFTDLAEALHGKQGLNQLATNPLTSLLDIAPVLGKFVPKAIADSAIGQQLADRIGVAPEELKTMTSTQIAWRVAANLTTGKDWIRMGPDGKPLIRRLNAGERVNMFRNSKNFGREQGELTRYITIESEKATDQFQKIAGPVLDSIGKLSTDELQQLNDIVYHDHRNQDAILNDDSLNLSVNQKDALDKIFDWERWDLNIKLASGDLVEVETPFGKDYYLAPTKGGTAARTLTTAKGKMQKASETLDEQSKEFDFHLASLWRLRVSLKHNIDTVARLRETLFDPIKASLPTQQGLSQDALRSILPSDQAFDRAVLRSDNLEKFFGLSPRPIKTIRRGNKDVEAFSGKFTSWSDPEKEAWQAARHLLTKSKYDVGETIPREDIQRQAEAMLDSQKLLDHTTTHAPVPARLAQTLADIAAPGGLIDRIVQAYKDGDWDTLTKASESLDERLSKAGFQSPDRSAALTDLQEFANTLKAFSRMNRKLSRKVDDLWTGRKGIAKLTRDYIKAANKWRAEAIAHPPDMWRNALLDIYTEQIRNSEHGARILDEAAQQLGREGYTESEVQKLRENPRTLMELISMSSKNSLGNALLPDFDIAEAKTIKQTAFEEVARLRARGEKPTYIPNVTPFDRPAIDALKNLNIFIGADLIPSIDSLHERSMDFGSSVYDIQTAITKDTRQILTRDATEHVIDELVPRLTFSRDDLEPLIRSYKHTEISNRTQGIPRGALLQAETSAQGIVEKTLEEWNLQSFDPKEYFGSTRPQFANKTLYMDKDLASALSKTVRLYQRGTAETAVGKAVDKVTDIFRESVLGYSLRFTLHILFGGSVLLAARSSHDVFRYISHAHYMAKTGKLPQSVIDHYNLPAATSLHEALPHSATQEGVEQIIFHFASGYAGGQYAIQAAIAARFGKDATDLKNPDWFTHYLKVIPNLNFRFTRFATSMQRSMALLDGMHQAEKRGFFYTSEIDEATGKSIRVRHEMTGDQALQEGFHHVEKVMGDLRAMSPVERSYLIKMFPFWGWTKHVLCYVASFPIDHPYRAMFLANLAWMHTEGIPPGLAIRTQLLTFLGKPDQYGNVDTLDTRYLNPLRDTANYGTTSGWISALNPVFTAPISRIDPNISFGDNVLYPNTTYNQLYGTTEAGAQGNWWNALEGVVPEFQGLDAALNLSGQYAYLHQSGNNQAFREKIFSSLNIEFLFTQSVNLRQMAAQGAMDRYNQAKNAAIAAWNSGDFSLLNGYGPVPDPRNDQYTISPADLQKVYNELLAANPNGLPPSAVAQPLPTPAL